MRMSPTAGVTPNVLGMSCISVERRIRGANTKPASAYSASSNITTAAILKVFVLVNCSTGHPLVTPSLV